MRAQTQTDMNTSTRTHLSVGVDVHFDDPVVDGVFDVLHVATAAPVEHELHGLRALREAQLLADVRLEQKKNRTEMIPRRVTVRKQRQRKRPQCDIASIPGLMCNTNNLLSIRVFRLR